MQIRNRAKPLGMTGLSNGLDTANWPWTHQYRARVPPWGVSRADALCVSTSHFSAKNVTTRINPHPPPSNDVSHNSSEVDIGVYG
jgi:hypothetical protein